MAPNTMNSSYLDIYMEGIAAGWVAVGFSDSRAMVSWYNGSVCTETLDFI